MLLYPFDSRLSSPGCSENRQGCHDAANVQRLLSSSLLGLVIADASYQSEEVWLCADDGGLFAICINLLCSLS